MTELETAEVVEGKEPFRITDDGSLHWTFRKMRELKGEISKKEELANADYAHIEEEKKLVDEWFKSETKSLNQSLEYFEQLVKDYHLQLLKDDPEQKTLSSPFGKSSSRRSTAQADKGDEDKLLAYAKENKLTDLINVKESVKWGDLKKTLKVSGNNVVDENGVIVEGAVVKPEMVACKVDVL